MRSVWRKLVVGILIVVLFLVGTAVLTGWPMMLFRPVANASITVNEDELSYWKRKSRELAEVRSGWYREKMLEVHFGEDLSEPYPYEQFGYCSFTECLILSNNFQPNEFRITVYDGKILGSGERLQGKLEELGIEFR